jgi:hypothetical protein
MLEENEILGDLLRTAPIGRSAFQLEESEMPASGIPSPLCFCNDMTRQGLRSGGSANDMRAKELAPPRMQSRLIGVAFEDLENLCKSLEVWQVKGLGSEEDRLGEGALTGETGRGTIPTDIHVV